MELRQVYRLITFAYVTALPSILIFWILPLLPEVIEHNLGIRDKAEISKIASFFEAVFFVGLIVGSLLWPYTLRYLSKRNALLLGMSLQGVVNALTGRMTTLSMFILFRFLTACCSNVNTIGKDFIFVFAKPQYRLYAYGVKNIFSVAAAFAGPILGYYVYEYCHHDLQKSLDFISMFYLVGIVLFVIVFYLDFHEGDSIENDTPEGATPPGDQKLYKLVKTLEEINQEPYGGELEPQPGKRPKRDSVNLRLSQEDEELDEKMKLLGIQDHEQIDSPEGASPRPQLPRQVSSGEVIESEFPRRDRPINEPVSDAKRSVVQPQDISESELERKMQRFEDSLMVSKYQSLYSQDKSLWEVFKECMAEKDMRNLIIVYFITNGVYKAQVLISIFFLETAWRNGGWGLSAKTVATISVLCYIPVALAILISPSFVPKRVSYAGYTKIMISTLLVGLFLVPFSRDMIHRDDRKTAVWVAYGIQALINISTPKMYSPFLNFIMNKSMHKDYRTSLNSITFILSNLSAAMLVLLVVPFYSISMFSPAFTQYEPWNKYFCFVFMDMFLMVTLPFVKSMDENFSLS